MPIYAVGDRVPRIHPSAFIAPTATVVGDVTIHEGASIWFGAVVRGDTSYVVIGPGANVQEGAVVHGRADAPALVGARVTIAHNALVHGAVIKDGAMVANGAMVLDGATVGEGSLIAAGALVLGGATIPPGVLAVGIPAEVKRPLAGTEAGAWVERNPRTYARLMAEYQAGLRELRRDEVPSP
jgi:carbonic anhydrase/acetyltransferase-like protein (isoleucine patch superfamily)